MASVKVSERPEKPTLRHLQTKDFGKLNNEQHKVLQDVSKAHVESFNYLLREGLAKSVMNIQPLEMELPSKDQIKIEFKDCSILRPVIHKDSISARTYKVYPAECRMRGITYKGKLQITVSWSKNGVVQDSMDKVVGEVPIMVKSNACNLNKLTPKQLVEHGEEAEEFGGYFIINGNERIVRMLIMQRRNYPIAMTRQSWRNRGELFTEYGISIRCVRSDQTGSNMVLHYLSDGGAKLMFLYRKELFFVPIMFILKALRDIPDVAIFSDATKGKEDDAFYSECVMNMLRQMADAGFYTKDQLKNHLGEMFRVKLGLPSWYTNIEVANFLLRECICIHLESDVDKYNLLIFMLKKLFAVAKSECALETPDNPMNQEVLVPGHLYSIILKDKLESWLFSVRAYIDRKVRLSTKGKPQKLENIISESFTYSMNLTRPVEYVFATGNFSSRSASSLMQFTGLTVVADKLNFWRYISHFRCVHRGTFFAQMRTTTVRKLLPEAWGFICPVHTPDGTPCGLLNHLTATCEVINIQPVVSKLERVVACLGVLADGVPMPCPFSDCYSVLLDGKILGWMPKDRATIFVNHLRYLKSSDNTEVPQTTEICFVPIRETNSQYPGIFLFTTPARMMRPVRNLCFNTIEWVGTFEQVYMNICVIEAEAYAGITTHQELYASSILSVIANMIPYSDFNPSPRNMYECQMGKQTMGTPCHALKYRSDNKLYRLQTPQSPLVKPVLYDSYKMDDYPLGTNAIVAVISYTGYDMEDAIILNKASVERGFKYGSIYKSEFVNLRTITGERGNNVSLIFGRKDTDKHIPDFIGCDGLPYIGTRLSHKDPICSYINLATGETKCERYSSTEMAYVRDVKLLGNDTGTDVLQKICITYEIPRKPSIGDKFANRHGQKGVCSLMMKAEDMPFTEKGMVPDILFNPHGFASRMTIGMVIEIMAGKSSALDGVAHDATPFTFAEDKTAGEYFADLLRKAGYDYYGTEKMYSGTSGELLEADIFMGVVYYQRLRHMVADKFQVRSTGPVDILTHQPIKGRKRGGGVRFGEMERDSLIAHGGSFLLQDRLFNCSDGTVAHLCVKCESILSPLFEKAPEEDLITNRDIRRVWTCNICKDPKNIELIYLPFVFRYLCAELAAVNIVVRLKMKQDD